MFIIGWIAKHLNILYIALFCCGIVFISSKANSKLFDAIGSTIVLALPLFMPYNGIQGTPFVMYLLLAASIVSVIRILDLVKLKFVDYAGLFSIIALQTHTEKQFDTYFGYAFVAALLFAVLLIFYRIRNGHNKGKTFHVWLTFLLVIIDEYILYHLLDFLRLAIGYASASPVYKIGLWLVFALCIAGVNYFSLHSLKRKSSAYLDELTQMTKRYPQMERYFVLITWGLIGVTTIVHLCYYKAVGVNLEIFSLLSVFLILAFILQLLYLTLIYRVTYLRQDLQEKEWENKTLSLYSSNLEKNLAEMRGIKHDIKNVFFTMGQYVEQSGNEQLQEFYQENIFPFAANEIAKNDLFGKLSVVRDERLKSFLFYKMSQALEAAVPFTFKINIASDDPPVRSIAFSDLVRILGILLDNAIEECIAHSQADINMTISGNSEQLSFVIKNSISSFTMQSGISKGVSTKGIGRGNGLNIAHGIIERYPNATLNSYFQNDCFVQSLSIFIC